MVHAVQGGTFDLKNQIRRNTLAAKIPLVIMFIIPPVESVPSQLLLGCGLTRSREVTVYGECDSTLPDKHVEAS